VEECNPRSKAAQHRKQIVVIPDAQRSCAEGNGVRIHFRLRHNPLQVTCCTYDSRQAKQWPRRIVWMDAQLDAKLRGHWAYRSQKLTSIFAEACFLHVRILRQQIAHLLQCVAAIAARQPLQNCFLQFRPFSCRERLKICIGGTTQLFAPFIFCTFALQ
jgi:hypothetical protein